MIFLLENNGLVSPIATSPELESLRCLGCLALGFGLIKQTVCQYFFV